MRIKDKYRMKIVKFHYEKLKCSAQVRSTLSMIMLFAEKYDWDVVGCYGGSYHILLKRDNDRMNVYLSTLTIQTAMNHPSKGPTQLNRKGLSFNQIEEIFKTPRVHTGKGYYVKRRNNG